ncbi:MAG: VOC family protein [Mangrovicoccus sp.]|nr:VOC family protein [Mangrovicoccus sp.]
MGLALWAVTLVVPDYDPAIAFYVAGLGFELRADIPQGPERRLVVVAPPGGATGLLLARAATDRQRAAIGAQTGGRVAFFLTTDDFTRHAERMSAAGAVFEEDPRHESYGIVAVWRDPFGNRWDLIQPA